METTGEEDRKVFIVFESEDGKIGIPSYQVFAVEARFLLVKNDEINHEDVNLPPKGPDLKFITRFKGKGVPACMGCGNLGSKIFLLGGWEWVDDGNFPPRYSHPTNMVACLNLQNPAEGFQKFSQSLIGRKMETIGVECGGKLYVFNTLISSLGSLCPIVEVFDPSFGKWDDVEDTLEFELGEGIVKVSILVFGARIYFSSARIRLCYLDTQTHEWHRGYMFEDDGLPFRGKSAMVVHSEPTSPGNGIVVAFCNGCLIMFVIEDWTSKLCELVKRVAPMDYVIGHFVTLGGTNFCLVSTPRVNPFRMEGEHIFVTTFNFQIDTQKVKIISEYHYNLSMFDPSPVFDNLYRVLGCSALQLCKNFENSQAVKKCKSFENIQAVEKCKNFENDQAAEEKKRSKNKNNSQAVENCNNFDNSQAAEECKNFENNQAMEEKMKMCKKKKKKKKKKSKNKKNSQAVENCNNFENSRAVDECNNFDNSQVVECNNSENSLAVEECKNFENSLVVEECKNCENGEAAEEKKKISKKKKNNKNKNNWKEKQ